MGGRQGVAVGGQREPGLGDIFAGEECWVCVRAEGMVWATCTKDT